MTARRAIPSVGEPSAAVIRLRSPPAIKAGMPSAVVIRLQSPPASKAGIQAAVDNRCEQLKKAATVSKWPTESFRCESRSKMATGTSEARKSLARREAEF